MRIKSRLKEKLWTA